MQCWVSARFLSVFCHLFHPSALRFSDCKNAHRVGKYWSFKLKKSSLIFGSSSVGNRSWFPPSYPARLIYFAALSRSSKQAHKSRSASTSKLTYPRSPIDHLMPPAPPSLAKSSTGNTDGSRSEPRLSDRSSSRYYQIITQGISWRLS